MSIGHESLLQPLLQEPPTSSCCECRPHLRHPGLKPPPPPPLPSPPSAAATDAITLASITPTFTFTSEHSLTLPPPRSATLPLPSPLPPEHTLSCHHRRLHRHPCL
mmetsp:Transcript_74110/g.147331  ORF Transcript_74110/g.147331 Transcript_74110/m.147331 type:complete len:106 (-) Transcript_74110:2601-2918(-)